jgi:hypothetical protein
MRFNPYSLMILVTAFLLAGCDATPSPQPGQPPVEQAPTLLAAIPSLPTVAATPTRLPVFDPQDCIDAACMMEGHFILENPIPVGANQSVTAVYRFGSTLEGEREIHHGVEFNNPSGTPVLAAADGKVAFAGKDAETNFGLNTNFYGNLVIIEHHLTSIPQATFTLYAHLSEVGVQTGEEVKAGQQIGEVGRSGSALGSHLHFEVRLGENSYMTAVNPELWLILTPDMASPTHGALAGTFLNAAGEPVRVTNIRLESSPIREGPPENYYALSTYYDDSLAGDPILRENFVISELPPGWYRLATIANGIYISEWMEVKAGKLTFLAIPLP